MGLHPVVMTVEGIVDYRRNCTQERVFGKTHWVVRKSTPLKAGSKLWETCAEASVEHFNQYYHGYDDVQIRVFKRLMHDIRGSMRINGQYVDVDYIGSSSYHLTLMDYMLAVQAEHPSPALEWLIKKWGIVMAEVTALDYTAIGVQGAADGTWVCPPETTDGFGLWKKDYKTLKNLLGSEYLENIKRLANSYYSKSAFIAAYTVAYNKRVQAKPVVTEDAQRLFDGFINQIKSLYTATAEI